MRRTIKAFVVSVIVVHGLLHLLGAAKRFGWTQAGQPNAPTSVGIAIIWLAAATLVIATAVLMITDRPWWSVGTVAVVASQGVICTSWTDAKAGTVGNVVLLAAVGYGYASAGPRSNRAEYRRRVRAALTEPLAAKVVTEADLVGLPGLIAAYLRRSGAVGQPRVANVRARFHGRIRAGAAKPWMTFTAEQVNTFCESPSRLFLMDATMFGLPIDVLHVFIGQSATMRVKACSVVPMVAAAGPEMDRGETVTMFNDLCVLAPAAIIDAPVVWTDIDAHHVRGTYTNGPNTVTAELTFNDRQELIDFASDDRSRASTDGKTFTPQRWSTPIRAYLGTGQRRIPSAAEARWHAASPEGEFAYLELHVDSVDYNVGTSHGAGRTPRPELIHTVLHSSPTVKPLP